MFDPTDRPGRPGWQFLHTPGPTNIPRRIMSAMAAPQADHRSPEFMAVAERAYGRLRELLGTTSPVVLMSAPGHGAWEAALVNPLAPGDRVLMAETGFFSQRWKEMAERLGLEVDYLPGDWRTGVDANRVEERLRADASGRIKAVCVVHNETSTGVLSDLPGVRAAMDAAGHPGLLIADVISSFASSPYRHDAWRVDVCVGGSQKGLMLPPGLAFNALSDRALEAARASGGCPRFFWDWNEHLGAGGSPGFISTPAIPLWYGLAAALEMLFEEGPEAVFARHRRLAASVRAAVAAWDLELVSTRPVEHSDTVSAILLPDGARPDAFRTLCRERYGVALAAAIGRWATNGFRIGHLGALSEAMILGTLGATELALADAGIPHQRGGAAAALASLQAARPGDAPLRAVG